VIDGHLPPEQDTIHPDEPATVDRIIQLAETVDETQDTVQQQADRLQAIENRQEQTAEEMGELTSAVHELIGTLTRAPSSPRPSDPRPNPSDLPRGDLSIPTALPYIRTSTDDQGQNPERQIDLIEAWAETHGVELLEPVVDEGTSASKTTLRARGLRGRLQPR
jgi:hypothetical protein